MNLGIAWTFILSQTILVSILFIKEEVQLVYSVLLAIKIGILIGIQLDAISNFRKAYYQTPNIGIIITGILIPNLYSSMIITASSIELAYFFFEGVWDWARGWGRVEEERVLLDRIEVEGRVENGVENSPEGIVF